MLGHVVTTRPCFEGLNVSKTTVQLRRFARAKTRYASHKGLSGNGAGHATAPHHAPTIYRGRAGLSEQSNSLRGELLLAGARLPFSIAIPETLQSGTEPSAEDWERENDERVAP